MVVTQGEQDLSAPYGNHQWLTTNTSATGKGVGTRREVRDSSEAGVAGKMNSAIDSKALVWCQGFGSPPRHTHFPPHLRQLAVYQHYKNEEQY